MHATPSAALPLQRLEAVSEDVAPYLVAHVDPVHDGGAGGRCGDEAEAQAGGQQASGKHQKSSFSILR